MRKGLILLSVFILLVGVYGLSWAAGVSGSKHDFRTSGDGADALAAGTGPGDASELCRSCHVPHKTLGRDRYSSVLLWQQTIHSGAGITIWSSADYWYTSWRPTVYHNKAPVDYADLDQASKRCLGCHDGGTFYLWSGLGANASTATVSIATGYDKFTALTDVHPVGIEYDEAVNDLSGEFNSQSVAVGDGIRFYDKATGKRKAAGDSDSYLGCGSCHDPHNTTYTDAKFIRDVMVGSDRGLSSSALCRACHKK